MKIFLKVKYLVTINTNKDFYMCNTDYKGTDYT